MLINNSYPVKELSKMKKLKELWIHNNRLKELPWNVKELKLQELDVRGNDGLGVAARLFVGKELRELEGWLSELESGSAIQDSIKVMLVGEGTFPAPSPFPPSSPTH